MLSMSSESNGNEINDFTDYNGAAWALQGLKKSLVMWLIICENRIVYKYHISMGKMGDRNIIAASEFRLNNDIHNTIQSNTVCV